MDLQYYPTPPGLAQLLWKKFKNKDFERVLEPSAGEGAIIENWRENRWRDTKSMFDAVEIDLSKHEKLQSIANVVGTDFLSFRSGAQYSHVIMNPPFAQGVQHVLHAWRILYDGEVVAILNAESLRNAFSQERKELLNLVREFGSVEFIDRAFDKGFNPEVQREADVEIAIVHLIKKADDSEMLAGLAEDLIGRLAADTQDPLFTTEHVAIGEGELMLPRSFIQVSVTNFKAAIAASREAIIYDARALNFKARLGRTLAEMDGGNCNPAGSAGTKFVRQALATAYKDLKERAWSGILRSTEVTGKLSSKAQKRIESEFAKISQMEFSEANIYGFLAGLCESGWQIQVEMMCDVFDSVTTYHSENTVYYKGWKSNDKHRTCGRRMKTTRFVLPRFSRYSSSFDFEALQRLRDLDKVFAMLDGVNEPAVSLHWAADNMFSDLLAAKRVETTYFDIRYYRGIQTIHFFPKRKDLVERLNRLVGQQRQWLPADDETACEDYFKHYREAEKMDAEIREEFEKVVKEQGYQTYSQPGLRDLYWSNPGEYDHDRAAGLLDKAMDRVLERKGYNVATLLDAPKAAAAIAAPVVSIEMARPKAVPVSEETQLDLLGLAA